MKKICKGCGTDKDFLGGPIILFAYPAGKETEKAYWCSWTCKNKYDERNKNG